jgi:hypothetical protein
MDAETGLARVIIDGHPARVDLVLDSPLGGARRR